MEHHKSNSLVCHVGQFISVRKHQSERLRRACAAILFHGSSFLSLEDLVDDRQRFGLLGGASSVSQTGKKQICCIHPPFPWLLAELKSPQENCVMESYTI